MEGATKTDGGKGKRNKQQFHHQSLELELWKEQQRLMMEKVGETSNRGTGVMEGTTKTDGGKGKRNKQQRNWSYGRNNKD